MTHAAPGRRAFRIASISLIVFGGVHLLAVGKALVVRPSSPQEITADRALRALSTAIGPFRPTAWHGMQILNASFSVLLIQVGVLNLLRLRIVDRAPDLRSATLANVIFAALLLIITIAFQFPPPMVFAAFATVAFVTSLVQQRRAVDAGSAR
ncbi:MAG: hypothetical protein CHACPFDD_01769 [Phycisphaerae bacterium]|nr:hypothetical protein [Phycisphaerae bacterium]